MRIGSTVEMVITELSTFGITGVHQGEQIVVMVPEVSWKSGKIDIAKEFQVGQKVVVEILRYSVDKNGFIGSVRRALSAESPYKKLKEQRCEGALIDVRLVRFSGMGRDGTVRTRVELPYGIEATMLIPQELSRKFAVGDALLARVIKVDADECNVKLEFVDA
ncbi:MAG: hypothetical protein R3C28_30110 [Pirellulaceae bacterium]